MCGGLRKVGVSTPDDHATITIHYPDLEFSLWWISLSDIWIHLAETKLHKWHQAEVGSIFTILAGPIQTVDTGYACVSKNGSEKNERTKGKGEGREKGRSNGKMYSPWNSPAHMDSSIL